MRLQVLIYYLLLKRIKQVGARVVIHNGRATEKTSELISDACQKGNKSKQTFCLFKPYGLYEEEVTPHHSIYADGDLRGTPSYEPAPFQAAYYITRPACPSEIVGNRHVQVHRRPSS